jgi:RimJ/RimL family protein N-acetyltransferase
VNFIGKRGQEGDFAEDGILVSQNAKELVCAKKAGMATLGYLGEEDKDAVFAAGADMYAEGMEEVDFRFLERVYLRCHKLPWTILKTKRCIIKEFSMEYLDALFELYRGEGMTDYMEPLYEYDKEREYQQAYIDNMYRFYGYGMWIVCEKKTGKLLGRAGVENREELGGELELGYAIGVPYQNQGYATEVCMAILSYINEELENPTVNCLIEEGNKVSEHLCQKLGFSFRGTIETGGKVMKRYTL